MTFKVGGNEVEASLGSGSMHFWLELQFLIRSLHHDFRARPNFFWWTIFYLSTFGLCSSCYKLKQRSINPTCPHAVVMLAQVTSQLTLYLKVVSLKPACNRAFFFRGILCWVVEPPCSKQELGASENRMCWDSNPGLLVERRAGVSWTSSLFLRYFRWVRLLLRLLNWFSSF